VSKFTSVAELLRPINSLMVGFAVVVGAAIASRGSVLSVVSLEDLIIGFSVGFTISASSMVLNDVSDIEIDKINAPWRPLPSGRVSVLEALALFLLLSIVGLLLSYLNGLDTFIVALSTLVVAILYNVWGKKTGLIGNIMVAYSVAIPLVYGSLLVDNPSRAIPYFWAMVFFSTTAREVVKDIVDVEGDKIRGVRSIAILYGEKIAAKTAFLLYLLAVAISPIPVLLGYVNTILYMPLVVAVDIGLLYDGMMLLKNPSKRQAYIHKKRVLVYMLVGLIAFYISSL